MNPYTEDNLVQKTTAEYLVGTLHWDACIYAMQEVFGASGTLGRVDEGEVLLVRYLRPALEDLNPGLPAEAYEEGIRILAATDIAASLDSLNREKYKLFMYGEEYTLVTVADYVLSHTPGNTVSNLSSTRALRDVTRSYGGQYNAAAVGEVNVTTKMKETGAVIGGEGNGGVIYPALHYGRDALVGIALFLSHLAHKNMKVSELRKTYPPYFIAKNRIDLKPGTDVDAILLKVKGIYAKEEINDIDGVKIDFPDKWVHLRKSNTEPIIRVYSEASTMEAANAIGEDVMKVINSMI